MGVELSYLTVPEQEMVEEVHESTGKYPSLEQAKKIRQHREEKTLTKEIVRLLVIGERKKKTTVTLKQDEIKKYFPPEYDEQTSLHEEIFAALYKHNPRWYDAIRYVYYLVSAD